MVCPMYEVLPHILEYCSLRLQPKHSHVKAFSHFFQIFLPLPTYLIPGTTTILQADTQSSTLSGSECPNHPVIHTFTPRMIKPPQSATSSTLNTLRLYKSTLRSMSLQRHSTHPSCRHTTPQLLSPDSRCFPPRLLLHDACHPNSKTWRYLPILHLVLLFQPLSAKLIDHDCTANTSCNGNL